MLITRIDKQYIAQHTCTIREHHLCILLVQWIGSRRYRLQVEQIAVLVYRFLCIGFGCFPILHIQSHTTSQDVHRLNARMVNADWSRCCS